MIYPPIKLTLVGPPGSGKGLAIKEVKKMLKFSNFRVLRKHTEEEYSLWLQYKPASLK